LIRKCSARLAILRRWEKALVQRLPVWRRALEWRASFRYGKGRAG
jgi:hypothetical protein